jgi:2Fe-2S ferredoxin
MPRLIIIDRKGVERTIEAPAGRSVMQTIRDAGYDELLALCGGCCSCATCHVHTDPAALPKLPRMTEDENDLLAGSSTRDEFSRLSCQITFTDELDGLRVTIALEG